MRISEVRVLTYLALEASAVGCIPVKQQLVLVALLPDIPVAKPTAVAIHLEPFW